MACFIQASLANYYGSSTLRYFRNELAAVAPDPSIIDIDWQIDVDDRIPLPGRVSAVQTAQRTYAEAPSFEANLLQRLWRRTSYSGLSPDHMPTPSPKADGFESTYDEFVFRTIRRGAHTGNLIHYIFERIDFRKPDHWETVIEKAIKEGMDAGLHYKEIYQLAKERVIAFANIIGKSFVHDLQLEHKQ